MPTRFDIQARKNAGVHNMVDIELSDTVDLPVGITRGIFCTASGNMKVTFQEGGIQTLEVTKGILYSFYISRVWLTGTTATVKACY